MTSACYPTLSSSSPAEYVLLTTQAAAGSIDSLTAEIRLEKIVFREQSQSSGAISRRLR